MMCGWEIDMLQLAMYIVAFVVIGWASLTVIQLTGEWFGLL